MCYELNNIQKCFFRDVQTKRLKALITMKTHTNNSTEQRTGWKAISFFTSPWLSSTMFSSARLLHPDLHVNKQYCDNANEGIPGGAAGGCLQRFVACVFDQSHGASGRGMVRSAERSPVCCIPPVIVNPVRFSSVAATRSSYWWRRKMIKTPGAVQTSQLIPRRSIGGERTSVTVGRAKQSTICSRLVVVRTKTGEGGGHWVKEGGMALRTAEEERKKSCVFFTGI